MGHGENVQEYYTHTPGFCDYRNLTHYVPARTIDLHPTCLSYYVDPLRVSVSMPPDISVTYDFNAYIAIIMKYNYRNDSSDVYLDSDFRVVRIEFQFLHL